MLSKRLRMLRRERDMTQQELGDAVGIARATIAGYEAGREPDLGKLRDLAAYFNVSVDYLVGASDIRQPARPDSFTLPEILVTLTDLANTQASAAEIMAALPDLSEAQLNRVVGYIQALQNLPDDSNVAIWEKSS